MDATLKERVLKAHIKANYPHAAIENWDDPDTSLVFYPAEELRNASDKWFPLCCYRDEASGKTVYGGREGILHTYTEGETGAGKTTRYAMQSIRALSATKGKPSFLVVDIHGELVENLYDHLKAAGYTIRVLNCDNPQRSDTYNPFMPLVQQCLQTGTLTTEVLSQIRKIAEIMQPVEDTKDPIWDQGARSYTNGLILDKFEDLLAGNIPPECITIYNIIENHFWLRTELGSKISDLREISHYRNKPKGSVSLQKLMAVTNNADRTRASYMGVAENHFDVFGQPALYQLSSSSTIDIDDFINEPTAIFIQSGTTSIGDSLISLMTNEIYNSAVRIGKQSANKLLPRKIHCFLDEFANSNIADGPEFIRMLTTSRKFGMYWHMLLQSDAQLERKFDPNIGRIIRSNCTEIFMGSHDYATLERFAKSCGKKTVESLNSLITGSFPSLETVDMITADKLGLLQEGFMYIKTNRYPLLLSYIEAFYKCPEFKPKQDILSVYPVNDFDYTTTAFFPSDLLTDLSKDDFRLLRALRSEKEPVRLVRLQSALPTVTTASHLRLLEKIGVIKRVTDDSYACTVSDRGYDLLEAKYRNAAPVALLPADYVAPSFDDLFDTPFDELLDKELAKNPPVHPLIQALYDHFKVNNITWEKLSETLSLSIFPAIMLTDLNRLMFTNIQHFQSTVLTDVNLPYRITESFISKNNFPHPVRFRSVFARELRRIRTADIFPDEMLDILEKTKQIIAHLDEETIRSVRSSFNDDDE